MLVISLVALFLAVYLANRIFISVHPGEAGVLWSRFFGGTRTDYVYPEGINYIFPWDEMHIYNIRVQQTAHEFDVLTVNGLKIHLFISIRYFPEYKLLGVLHQKVGPDYVETVVIPEIESVLRVLIGRLSAEEVYTTEKSIIEKSVNQAVEQIAQRFINVDNVIIKRVEFPAFVAKAIEQKIEQKQLAAAHLYKVEREKYEAERKRVEAEGFKRYHEILLSSLTNKILRWRDIQATLELSKSNNSKVVIIGGAKDQFQLFGDIPLEITPQPVSPETPVTQDSSPETNEFRSSYPNLTGSQFLYPNISGNLDMSEPTDRSGMSEVPDNSNSPDADN
ncbi:MAG: prohibitin family protein [bacterium]|nr:prohibitin family protein [bacterium]